MHPDKFILIFTFSLITLGLIFGLLLPAILNSLSTQNISYTRGTSNSSSYSSDTSSWNYGDSGSYDDTSNNDSSSCDSGGSDGGGCDSSGD